MELGTIIGFASGFFFIIISILINSGFDFAKLMKMLDLPSLIIVLGGSLASLFVAYPMNKAIDALKGVGMVFKTPSVDPAGAIKEIIDLANLARKEGLLALEDAVQNVDNEFLKKGVMLVVDGTDPELARSILETELSYVDSRHKYVIAVWEFLGSMGPAWGMIGTLIGLVMMLQDLNDPSTIGPNMAVALLTTFYGSVFSNLVFNPIANKLKTFSDDEILMKEVLIEGMLSIQAGENPRIIEEKLKAFLSPALRSTIGEKEDGDN